MLFTAFLITYENEDGVVVRLSDIDVDVDDLFRCVVPVGNADYRRMRINHVEGLLPRREKDKPKTTIGDHNLRN